MDSDINIWIYILFVAVSIIVSIVNGANKKKEAERQQKRKAENSQNFPESSLPPISGPSKTVNPFEEFLRRQLEKIELPEEEPLDSIPEKKPVPVDFVIPKTTFAQKNATINIDTAKEGEVGFYTTTKELYSDHNFDSPLYINDEIKDLEKFEYDSIADDDLTLNLYANEGFDAEKAIVYSEILKRPVY